MNNELAINTLKINGVAAVNKANSGHPGIVLGAATMLYTLYTKHLIIDPRHPDFINRDRFILSVGHGSALLYAQLRILDFISKEDLINFRQLGSLTPGHPEYGHTKGVDATTGPLGQGIAMSVGVAVAEAHLHAKFSEINHYTYVICGDGDLQEGVAMESMSFAGHQQLSKLIVLHDSNDIQLDTPVKNVFSENLELRMKAINWEYILVKENTVEAIDAAINQAKTSNKPSFIEVKTIIGEGASNQGTSAVHGAPLGDDFAIVKKALNWNIGEFDVPDEVKTIYQETTFKKGAAAYDNFKASAGLTKWLENKEVKINLDLSQNVATRVSSGEVIEHLNHTLENWMGGSADLAGSTKAKGGDGDFGPTNRLGRNILFGVREFAMGAIANGMALHSNFKPFVSTFFVFSDYMKPSMRLAALMGLPITYVFTHDSIFVGEDGPTHEPIEHSGMLRALPNLNFIRPGDEVEVAGAYEVALNSQTTPTVITLTRQNIQSMNETSKDGVKQGAYQLHKGNEWTLVATGSELANALEIGKEFNLNVVSMPNTHVTKVDWDINKAITIEAATTFGMAKYGKYNFGIDTFGASGDGSAIYKYMKLDKESLITRIKEIIHL
ncbi:transketolase [Candidatus Mycoplasma mahonii]|uniref:transketolase n=1 Tax=Candidatus Mycoplasma mahonii TaxID=3004105 RepID=UPI0026F20A38|nr:transketolase [Candidatus Mycoplasma mahonii]WKX02210.1 transketolase [Candidatus Mycoplasma mahonii]